VFSNSRIYLFSAFDLQMI